MNAIYLQVQKLLLRMLRVPAAPTAPAGAVGSLKVFRAGCNFYRLRIWLWSARQILAVLVILFALFFFHLGAHRLLETMRSTLAKGGQRRSAEVVATTEWVVRWFPLLEIAGLGFAVLQMPFTYALIRLDYEQRWYLVTDRSLRIREGLWNVREMTLSFANIQQITLRQGPLQRSLGLADLVVTTAGGGSPAPGQPGASLVPWHTGVLRAVDNADELRDLIQERLRRLRSAGTGDVDDPERTAPESPRPPALPGAELSPVLAAARGLLAEVRALREEWVRG